MHSRNVIAKLLVLAKMALEEYRMEENYHNRRKRTINDEIS